MNYTKGEWKCSEAYYCESNPFDDIKIKHYFVTGTIGGNTERTIADIGEWTDRPNALDDAHLIAAAPDMYEILKAIEAYQKDGLNRWEWIQNAVNKALAKAEGK